MNAADTEQMASLLAESGHRAAPSIEAADLVILNGCEVRDKAVHKMLSSLGKLKAKGDASKKMVGIGGCVGSLKGSQLFAKNPHVDFVFGTDTIAQLPELVHRVEAGERHVVFNAFDKKDDYEIETKVFTKSASAFVNIMKGCDKFCSYCIVPYTRGREKSRPLVDIVKDVERLLVFGVKEITLLGQNVNSYGKGYDASFVELLRAVDGLKSKGLKRLRYTSSHPLDFSDELISCYGELETLAPHLHLPVQSGSNAVLQKMHRHYKIERFYEQIAKWRAVCPEGGLTTDIIVGFPTETDDDFEGTMKLARDMRFDMVYSFAYSPRPGTKAVKLVDNVPASVKNERLVAFQKLVVDLARENNQRWVGRTAEVLVEGPVKALQNAPQIKMWQGRLGTNHVVNFPYDGPRDLAGQMLDIRIEKASGLAMMGVLEVLH
jgi:tRNA-2-methylthio-N6-dimethylallyladenosine synthase